MGCFAVDCECKNTSYFPTEQNDFINIGIGSPGGVYATGLRPCLVPFLGPSAPP